MNAWKRELPNNKPLPNAPAAPDKRIGENGRKSPVQIQVRVLHRIALNKIFGRSRQTDVNAPPGVV